MGVFELVGVAVLLMEVEVMGTEEELEAGVMGAEDELEVFAGEGELNERGVSVALSKR